MHVYKHNIYKCLLLPKKTLYNWFDTVQLFFYRIPAECIMESHRFTPEQFEQLTTQSYDERKTLSPIDKETIKELYSPGKQLWSPSFVNNLQQCVLFLYQVGKLAIYELVNP